VTSVRNCSGYVCRGRDSIDGVERSSIELKPTILPLAMGFRGSHYTKDFLFFGSVGYLGSHSLRIDLV